jgi:hypothetical protein
MKKKGLLGSVDAPPRMKLLTAVGYKDGMIYVRQVDRDLFIWDAVWQNQLYSSFIVITPEDDKELPPSVIDHARDMCYAGAASTIDFQRGEGVSDQEKEQIEVFEQNRLKVEKTDLIG